MEVLYKSTRGAEEAVTASCAILKGLAKDGGLFVPTEIPKLSLSMEELSKMSYQETAYEVMKLFLTDFTEEELKGCLLSGVVPWSNDCIQGYGSFDFAISDDNSSKEESYQK